jgi:elongation factor G
MTDNGSGRSETQPRSIALVGPYGSGKSTLFESLLGAAGSPVKRLGDVRGRVPTTDMRLGHCQFMGDPWAILDCPGSVEFAQEAVAALAVVDLAVVVCEPAPEKALSVAPLLRHLQQEGVPHLLFINKIDTLDGRARDTLAALQHWSPQTLVLRQVPIHDAGTVTGYVDLASERAYKYRKGAPSYLIGMPQHVVDREKEARFALLEALADHDDALMEKLLDDVAPTTDEIYRQLHKDLLDGAVVPVLLGAGESQYGVKRLWKALRHDTPTPSQTAARRGVASEGEALAQVCKTIHAGHGGKLSYARIWRGGIKDGATLNGQRIGGVTRFRNGEAVKAPEATAGDIVAFGRLDGALTGSTLSPSGQAEALPWPAPPAPVYALAIATADHKDDVKLSGALQKLTEEDPCIQVVHDVETDEIVLHGQGEIHLNAAVERLSKSSGVKLKISRPRVPFKETIRVAVAQHSRLKRQTGGHGQFADVTLKIAPRERGDGFVFKDKIVGGAVPKQYIPAVGEAAAAATGKGPLGYRVVDIEVVLVDGTYHAVDSSDMAFKSATRAAMQEGLAKADPMLLEPIHHVTVSVPADYTSSAQRLLTGRRARILSYGERPGWPGWDDVEARMPETELQDLIIELRSLTMGLGTYRHTFDHLAELRGNATEHANAG